MECDMQLRGRRVTVLGAGGFLGTNLCIALRRKGAAVRAVGRRQLFPGVFKGMEWVQGDIADPYILTAALEGADLVFHLANATTPHSSNAEKIGDIEENLITTVRLLEVCRDIRPSRIVYISSGGTVYGIPKSLPLSEQAPTDPISAYGITKLSAEKYFALFERLYGIDYRVLRLANPFGPFQLPHKNQGVVAAFVTHALRDEPIQIWGDGSVVRDFVFVDDAIDAMLAAASHFGEPRTFNIGSGYGRSLLDVIHAVEAACGKAISVQFNGGRIEDVPAVILDVSLARGELHWTANTEFEPAILRTVRWMECFTPGL